MFSIYHFFKQLIDNKEFFIENNSLSYYPFDKDMLSCQNNGIFPDLAIRLNKSSDYFTGGELIELKDSKSYTVSSFNSTIPTGLKDINKVIKGKNSSVKKQMELAGDDIDSLLMREVYYLVRGKNKGNTKVALIHGNFFETVKTDMRISQSFEQVLSECLQEKGIDLTSEYQKFLVDIFSEQTNFSKVRSVDKSSVKLRFRIMTEVKAEGNILNTKKYPDIKDNTINLIIPCHSEKDEEIALKKLSMVSKINMFSIIKIKHLLNGYFLVFQQGL